MMICVSIKNEHNVKSYLRKGKGEWKRQMSVIMPISRS